MKPLLVQLINWYAKHVLVVLFSMSFIQLSAQPWAEKMQVRSANFYDIQQQFNTEWGNRPYLRGYGWKQYKRWENFWEPRVFPHGVRPTPNHAWKEHLKFQRSYPHTEESSRSSNWTAMGPFSWTTSSYNPGIGRVNAVAEDPNNSSTLYIGAPAGGCWKSNDGGSTWNVLTDQFQSLGVSAIAVDYNNSNTIYIGTGDDDANDTYSIGLFKSTDGGSSWHEVTPSSSSIFGTQIYKIILHPTNSNTLFIATSTGCHKSIDGGNTWTLLRSGSWRDMELKPSDPNTIYLSSKKFYVSRDGGLSWTQVTIGLPSFFAINRAEIAVSADKPDYVYFLCGDNSNSSFYGLYRSDNSGSSFSLQANSPNIFAYDMTGADLSAGQSWYDMALAVSPSNAEEVYVGGINVWKSIDGGVTYSIKTHWVYPPNVGYVHADIHTLEFFGNNLYCGSDGGIFKSSNNGNNFVDLSAGLGISQFYRIGGAERVPNKIMGGTQDNGSNLIENGAARHTNGGDGMEALISNTDTSILYSSSQYGNFKRSDDGGYTFTNIFTTQGGNGAWVTPLAMNPQDNDMLIAGFDQVYFSWNKGSAEFVISNFNLGGDLLQNLAIAPSDGYNYFYAGTYDKIYATDNGSFTWTDISAGLPIPAMSSITVHSTNPQKIWLSFSGYVAGQKVYTSEDGGANWTNISANLPNIPINCLVHQAGSANGIYVGTDVGVYYTDSLLAGWQQFMTGLPNVIVRDLEINYTAGKIRAGTYGRGLWQSDLRSTLATPPVADFTYLNSQCTSDSIEFTDLSVDHAAGWIWHFPGGSPSTSTAMNPKVSYPTTGIYNVTLVVQNLNGVDSITKAVPITFQPNLLDFDLQLDNAASEVSWNIKDGSGSTLYSSALFALSGQDSQFIQQPICLPAGCYTLTMVDLGSNGLCCSNGTGYYLLSNTSGDTLAFGDNYASSDTTTFCVNQSTPLAIGASVTHPNCGFNDGIITITAIGGNGSFNYSIDSGATFQSSDTFFNVATGAYSILVQDSLGQQLYTTAVVNTIGIPVAVASVGASTVFLNQGGLANFFSTNSNYATSFLWTFPGGSSSTQAHPSFAFTTGGTYQVVLRVSNGPCSDLDTISVTVIDNVNIEAVENKTNIAIIPNPIQDKFLLEIEFGQLQEDIEIVIHNAIGQKVFWQQLGTIKSYRRQIHFGNEPDGVYVITVLGSGVALSRKFVKG